MEYYLMKQMSSFIARLRETHSVVRPLSFCFSWITTRLKFLDHQMTLDPPSLRLDDKPSFFSQYSWVYEHEKFEDIKLTYDVLWNFSCLWHLIKTCFWFSNLNKASQLLTPFDYYTRRCCKWSLPMPELLYSQNYERLWNKRKHCLRRVFCNISHMVHFSAFIRFQLPLFLHTGGSKSYRCEQLRNYVMRTIAAACVWVFENCSNQCLVVDSFIQ